MDRSEFREAVFARDNYQCVVCFKAGTDAHHLLERRLWPDGGYHLDNGVTLCDGHHWQAERTYISVEGLRKLAGITNVLLPPNLSKDKSYDKWGNEILPSGKRLQGPLFNDEGAQRALAPVLYKFVERYSSHADLMLCKCGHSWGMHPYPGQRVGPPGNSKVTDGGCEVCPCKEWIYDTSNKANRYTSDPYYL